MYKTITEAIELANGIKREFFKMDSQNTEVVLCPPFTALAEVSEVIADSDIQLGAQDVYWQEEGAFTGEISCKMLKDAGCKFVIIGHSERRQFFGEINAFVNKKLKAALSSEITPIVCVGEALSEREGNRTFEVLGNQIKEGLDGITEEDALKIVIAYEPVWAIGTGRTAKPIQAQETQKYIRNLLKELYNNDVAEAIRIQYGGSVKLENILELIQQPDVDGALVGGASLSIESFAGLVKIACGVKK